MALRKAPQKVEATTGLKAAMQQVDQVRDIIDEVTEFTDKTITLSNGYKVHMRSPTIGDLLSIEESKKQTIGNFEQSLIMLSKIITRFNDKTSVNVATLSTLRLEDINTLSSSLLPSDDELQYDIDKTPSGNECIIFNISGDIEVSMIRPNTLMLLDIDREIARKHKGAGDIKRALIMTARMIVKFGDKVGENIVKYSDLTSLSLQDWGLVQAASSIFFRS
jgi:hypothetical protein